LDNVLTHKTADLSTQMQLITPKPIQFDLAYNSLTYPELEKKEEVKKGGFWGKLNIFKK
jgi:signal recognition particle subunit SRP68